MKITITRPDDWHTHLRDQLAPDVIHWTARVFGRCTAMPNLTPPIKTVEKALDYRAFLLQCLTDEEKRNFKVPYVPLYFTDDTSLNEIKKAADFDSIIGFKVYPAGATTNSSEGVTTFSPQLKDTPDLREKLKLMSELGIPLLLHGEVADPRVGAFNREEEFVRKVFTPLVSQFPKLKVVLEHVSTSYGAERVYELFYKGYPVAATVTPHHLRFSHNDLFYPGLNPALFCRPILQGECDRSKLATLVTAGHPCFFAGTDSAPHGISKKCDARSGAAGVFSAPYAVETYAQIFSDAGELQNLEAFLSVYGANFFGLPYNESSITLESFTNEKDESKIPPLPNVNSELLPMPCDSKWRVVDD